MGTTQTAETRKTEGETMKAIGNHWQIVASIIEHIAGLPRGSRVGGAVAGKLLDATEPLGLKEGPYRQLGLACELAFAFVHWLDAQSGCDIDEVPEAIQAVDKFLLTPNAAGVSRLAQGFAWASLPMDAFAASETQ